MRKRASPTAARSLPTIAPALANAGAAGTSRGRTGRRCIWATIRSWPIPCPRAGAVTEGTQNVTNLAGFFNTARYLAPTSDIVALMTLEHQTRMTNLMTRIGWDARIALREGSWTRTRDRINARDRGTGRLYAFRGRGAAEGAGQGRLDVYQDVCRSGGLGIQRAGRCGTSIFKSGCSGIRCRT